MMCLGPNPLHNNGNCFTVLILLLQAKRWDRIVMTGALFAVDTFLTLSGVLLCYIFMVTMSKMGNFNLIIYFLHRYMR
jgi:peptidoglycan/LPS O-acetylase OafA/YrhL